MLLGTIPYNPLFKGPKCPNICLSDSEKKTGHSTLLPRTAEVAHRVKLARQSCALPGPAAANSSPPIPCLPVASNGTCDSQLRHSLPISSPTGWPLSPGDLVPEGNPTSRCLQPDSRSRSSLSLAGWSARWPSRPGRRRLLGPSHPCPVPIGPLALLPRPSGKPARNETDTDFTHLTCAGAAGMSATPGDANPSGKLGLMFFGLDSW